MRLTYMGHSSFMLTTSDGVRLLTDPYRPGSYQGAIRYAPILEDVDVVSISHDHEDHNNVESLLSRPLVVTTSCQAKGIRFRAFSSWHDAEQGATRGPNRIFSIQADDIAIVHCGDLGHGLDDTAIHDLGAIDILLIPVGGRFTIGPEEANDIIARVNPGVAIPMHYKTEHCRMPILELQDFAEQCPKLRRLPDSSIDFFAGQFPSVPEIVSLEPTGS